MFDKRLAVQTFPNPLIRDFHVTGVVSNTHIFEVSRDQISECAPKSTYGTEANCETCILINDLFKNRAIDTVSLDETTVRIALREVFYWHEAQDDVIDAIMARLGWLKEETAIMSLNDFRALARQADLATVPADALTPTEGITENENGS